MSNTSKTSSFSLRKHMQRFKNDERGVTAITFAIVGTLLTSSVGASVEYSRTLAAKNALQVAVDAAVLQAKRREMDLSSKMTATAARESAKAAGKKVFWANINGGASNLNPDTITIDIEFNNATGEALATGKGDVNLIFGKIIGHTQMKLAAQAEATWSNTTPVELALALDATPSMFSTDGRSESRFTLLRNASKNFVTTLFNSATDPTKELLRISVVPWATTVNIRSEAPRAPSSASYTSPGTITDAGSQIPMTNQMDRSGEVDIVDDFAPVGWRGCVSGANEAPNTYDDSKPVSRWKAQFVPSETLATLKNVEIESACTKKDYIKEDQDISTSASFYSKTAFQYTTLSKIKKDTCYAADKIKNNPACVSDPNELVYNAANGDAGWCPWRSKVNWTSYTGIGGPNINCPAPIVGLTSNRSQVMEQLDRIAPVSGHTHADVGLRWALRTLSPKTEWKNFFGVTTPIAEYNSTTTKKYLILITDGQNTVSSSFPGFWGCSTGSPGCTGTTSDAELDTRMNGWCAAIKDTYKIKIITIALNVTDTNAVNLLKNCASLDDTGKSMAHTIDAADVDKVLQEIAVGVANNLRLKS
ncbi:MAG: TadE/TadG family type IV pilus assembly protein [Beijerinckiaceae bacterium]